MWIKVLFLYFSIATLAEAACAQPVSAVRSSQSPSVYFDRQKQLYKVTIKKNGREVFLVYNLSQKINQIREKVNIWDLPKNVRSQLTKYKELNPENLFNYTQSDGTTGYVVDSPDKDIYFTKKGILIYK